MQDLVCALQEWSPVELQPSRLTGLQKLNALGAPPPIARHSGREPDVELRTLTPMGELLQYNYSPVCWLHTCGVWDLIILQV